MGYREIVDSHFGKRVRAERVRRRWSQQELAERLTAKGVPVHPSTIAKIESDGKKQRAPRLGEATALAELFELSVDELLGRSGPDTSTLAYALDVLAQYTSEAERHLHELGGTVADIEDQLESVEASFPVPFIEDMKLTAHAMDTALNTTRAHAHKLAYLVVGSLSGVKTRDH